MNEVEKLKAQASEPSVSWVADLERHTAGVAEAMTAIHGGQWNVRVNHDRCFVLIAREIEGWSPEGCR